MRSIPKGCRPGSPLRLCCCRGSPAARGGGSPPSRRRQYWRHWLRRRSSSFPERGRTRSMPSPGWCGACRAMSWGWGRTPPQFPPCSPGSWRYPADPLLPNFLVIGAPKAGTTSLYHYLRLHPQVFMPATKELSFFVEQNNWPRGRAWYEEQFSGAVDAAAIGEASPRYTMYPQYAGVPARIADLLPDIRLIYLVRHPIERMRSHYLDHVIYGAEKAPIEKALLDNPLYLNASRYDLQIEQYMPHY